MILPAPTPHDDDQPHAPMIPRSDRPSARASRRLASLVALLALASVAAGCASAKKRYRQGQDLARRGDYAEAAEHYIQALRKDERHEGARAGLREAGDSAVAVYVRRAAAADSGGRAVDGAELFLAADDLRRDARAVGTELSVPVNYSELRRGVFDHALAATLATARALTERGEWDDAETLGMKLRRGERPGFDEATRQIIRAGFAVQYAANNGVRHGNLTPHSLILSGGTVRVG